MILANKVLITTLFFILGIFLASFDLPFWILFLILFLIFFLKFLFKFKISNLFVFFTALFLFFGFFYYQFRIFLEENNKHIIFNKKTNFEAKIINSPVKYEKYQEFNVKLLPPFNGKINVIASVLENYNYGDVLSIYGIIEKNKNVINNPESAFPEIEKIGNDPDSKIYLSLLNIKNYFLSQFKKYLPKDESALASGILLGERSDFSSNLKNAMNNSGTTHIVALSGYNISILVIVVTSFFGFILGRKKSTIFTLIFIFLFVFMTGAEASVVRAAIMGSLIVLAGYFGRFYSFWHSMIFAAGLMILINPKILVFDLGFQLSFLSMIGISYFKPLFSNIFNFNENDYGFLNWKDDLTTTLGAQFGVAPLLLYKFGSFSLISFLANILILFFVPIAMMLGFILGIFGFFSFFGFIFSNLLSFILKYQIFIMKFFSGFPKFNNNILSWAIIGFIYLFLFLGFRQKKLLSKNSV